MIALTIIALLVALKTKRKGLRFITIYIVMSIIVDVISGYFDFTELNQKTNSEIQVVHLKYFHDLRSDFTVTVYGKSIESNQRKIFLTIIFAFFSVIVLLFSFSLLKSYIEYIFPLPVLESISLTVICLIFYYDLFKSAYIQDINKSAAFLDSQWCNV